MFEHERAALAAQRQGYLDAQATAQQERVAAENALGAAQQAAAAAQQAVDAAFGVAQAAQGRLDAARADQQAKQGAVNAAQADLAAWAASEPVPDVFPNGKPNPKHAAWALKERPLRQALADAKAALDAANAQVAAASGPVNDANAQLAARRNDLAARQQDVARLQQAIVAANAKSAAAAVAAARVDDQVTALDQRAARANAQPLDRADLTSFADEEQDVVSRLRRTRAATRNERYANTTARSALLTGHDADIEALHALADTMRTSGLDLTGVVAQLDSIVTTARNQRAAGNRADDLAGLAGQVRQALGALAASAEAAARDRDVKKTALDAAIVEVTEVQRAAP